MALHLEPEITIVHSDWLKFIQNSSYTILVTLNNQIGSNVLLLVLSLYKKLVHFDWSKFWNNNCCFGLLSRFWQ